MSNLELNAWVLKSVFLLPYQVDVVTRGNTESSRGSSTLPILSLQDIGSILNTKH